MGLLTSSSISLSQNKEIEVKIRKDNIINELQNNYEILEDCGCFDQIFGVWRPTIKQYNDIQEDWGKGGAVGGLPQPLEHALSSISFEVKPILYDENVKERIMYANGKMYNGICYEPIIKGDSLIGFKSHPLIFGAGSVLNDPYFDQIINGSKSK